MNFKGLAIFFIILLFCSGCTNQNTSNNSNKTTTSKEDIEVVENGDIMEGTQVGETITEEGDPIPEDLIGTWICQEGLPETLSYYGLVIQGDGLVQQVTKTTDGIENTSDSHLILNGNELTLVDENNISLMVLYYNNNQLLTDGLGVTRSIFTKEG